MTRPYISRPVTTALLEHFEKRLPAIRRGADECWPYSPGGERSGMYGRVSRQIDGVFQQALAHRVAATYFLRRTIKDDELVLHSCDYKPCVNPAHLRVGSSSKNQVEAYARNLRGKTHCLRGHALSLDNVYVYPTGAGGWRRQCKPCLRIRERSYGPRRR